MIKAVKAGMGNYMWLAVFAQFALYEINWYVAEETKVQSLESIIDNTRLII